ncbi:M56 family metallopeptidase, partial [Stenotrophomonas sp.]
MDMMMSEVLMRLGWTSLQSAVLVALVWGVCRLLPQLPSATRCRLWWLVAAQAVLGLLWSSPLELAVLPAPAPAAVTAPAMALPAFDAAVQAAPVTYAATALESATMTASWPLLLLAAWAAGVLLMLMHSLRGYRASRALVRSATECTD